MNQKLSIGEKIAYAMGDGSANIAWRGVSTFLTIFYLDVFGLTPAAVGILMLVCRFSDGVSDVAMGIIGDRTKSRYGKFRPWILWTALPLGIILSLLFTCPNDWSTEWKLVYAYVTYLLFTLIYTANNIPYGALMAVMTPDDKERTSLGSYRMVGAFAGGMIVQGALLYLVTVFGNINPTIDIQQKADDEFLVGISAPQDVQNVKVETKDGIATFQLTDLATDEPTVGKSIGMAKDSTYNFIVKGESNLTADSFRIVDQQQGYGHAIYLLSGVLVLCLLITFYFTRERVSPPKEQKDNLGQDFKELIRNRPWIILLIVGLIFNIYNNTKQGITVIYFTHYVHDQLMAGTYMVGLMLASIVGAMATTPISNRIGKKRLFMLALLATGAVNALIALCGPQDTVALFALGLLSEVAAAVLPTLFFTMLGDAADYSEYVNGRRATGLVYSAGSFATKFGGGIAGAIIGFILGLYGYDGKDSVAIGNAVPGIIMLMSWVPAIIVCVGAAIMAFYPIDQKLQSKITEELNSRRAAAADAQKSI